MKGIHYPEGYVGYETRYARTLCTSVEKNGGSGEVGNVPRITWCHQQDEACSAFDAAEEARLQIERRLEAAAECDGEHATLVMKQRDVGVVPGVTVLKADEQIGHQQTRQASRHDVDIVSAHGGAIG